MDDARNWMWRKRRHGLSSHLQASAYNDSWEEQAFAEDAAGSLGGCVWPPRSYSCTFCGREFTSAQALGGHMNVHRRDRARLKNSPSELLHHTVDFRFQADEPCSFSHNPNPNSKHATSLPPLSSEIAQDHPMKSPNSPPKPCSNFVEDGYYHFSDLWNEGDKSPGIPESGCSKKADLSECYKEELGCKRKRTDDTTILPFFLKPNSMARYQLQPAVVSDQCSPSSVNDIDLELRLGDGPRKYTRKNYEEELDDNHVRLDIYSCYSIEQRSLSGYGVNLSVGVDVLIVIVRYDGRNMNVFVSNRYETQMSLVFSVPVDLSLFLPESVHVGFSASTGEFQQLNYVRAWEFYGENVRKDSNLLWVWIFFSILVLSLILGFGLYIHRRRRSRKDNPETRFSNIEDHIKSSIVPRRFKLGELKRARDNFNHKNKLGKGGFGMVYKGIWKEQEIVVSVEEITSSLINN